MLLGNQVDALQKHFKKDHVHMRLWTRLYGIKKFFTVQFYPLKALVNIVFDRFKKS